MRSEEAYAEELVRLTVRTRVLDFMQVQFSSDTRDEVFTSSWIKMFEVLFGGADILATHMSRVANFEAQNFRSCRSISLAKFFKARHDSLSWNLSRVKRGGAIRADDMDHKTEGAGRAYATPSQVQDEVHVLQRELETARSMEWP